MESQKTPIFEWHVKHGGKMVDFAGWQLPVEFSGLRDEHNCVRNNAGLFDVSHMGEIRVKGKDSLSYLQKVTTNDVSQLKQGFAQYSLFPNENGGVVDDLIVYCLKPSEEYFLCVNAANTDKDFAWLKKQNGGFNVEVTNESPLWGQIALQGPKALAILSATFGPSVENQKPFTFLNQSWNGQNLMIAFTGYTGERGCEIFVPWGSSLQLWELLMQKGQSFGVKPIGLGARDTLRTEMKYSLYGHEINDETNPYEAGLGWVVKPDAKDFIGKDKILRVKTGGLKQKLVGLEMVDRGIARQGYSICDSTGKATGVITSGTYSPSLDRAVAIGFVPADKAELGFEHFIEIRQKLVKAKVVKTPFVGVKA